MTNNDLRFQGKVLRPVPKFPGYFVTKAGEVYSTRALSPGGVTAPHLLSARLLNQVKHLSVSLYSQKYKYSRSGKRGTFQSNSPKVAKVKHLVAASWLPPPAPGKTILICKDFDPMNCEASNLKWISSAELYTILTKRRKAKKGCKQ